MLKTLIESSINRYCRKLLPTRNSRLYETIPVGTESGTYIMPEDGIVLITGHCTQVEASNRTGGGAISISTGESVWYKASCVWGSKGDAIDWMLTGHQGRTTALYFFYTRFDKGN